MLRVVITVSETAAGGRSELLRSGRRVLLLTAGYAENEVAGFGDLAAMKSEAMRELLNRKTVEADVLARPPKGVRRFGAGGKKPKPQ